MALTPEIEGTVSIRSPAARFFEAFRQRVAAGLLTGRPHPRSHYAVNESGPGHLEVLTVDWPTAVNVGLNRVELRHVEPNLIRYHVRYWTWAKYVLGLSGALGIIGIVLLITLDVRGYIAGHSASRLPGLSLDQNVGIAWLMVLFWGFIWPWLLISLHKGPLRKLITRLIAEVDTRES